MILSVIATRGNKYKKSLSKSLYIRGLQCHKSLFLHKHYPELKDELTEQKKAIFQNGIMAGIYAHKLFPGGVEIPYDSLTLEEQLKLTKEEIKKGTKVFYEAAFKADDVYIKADIFLKRKSKWELYEVKAATSVKDYYYDDVALQYYVLEKADIPVSKASVIYINNQYVKDGEIEADELFVIEDITEEVRMKQEVVARELNAMKKMLKGDMPDMDIGEHCTKPYDCDFMGHCWKHVPEYSVFNLNGRKAFRFSLYRKGIIDLKDVPMDNLNDGQCIQVETIREQKDFISKDNIKDFLESLWYPMYFLDFETVGPSIPMFDGARPYQQVPTQYSLHYLEEKDSELKHCEFIAEPGTDPRKALIKKLIKEIPLNACVLVYSMSFEKGKLEDIAQWLPEYRDRIEKIIENLRDLAVPFRRKDYYHWQMKGSWSIKAVLPALVPEMSYEGMEVSDGFVAMEAYNSMCQSKDPEEVESIRNSLLEYCKLDTLAMVKLVEKLMELN